MMAGARPYVANSAVRAGGKIASITGTVVRVVGIGARIGDLCCFHTGGVARPLLGEVVGLHGEEIVVMPIGPTDGLSFTSVVESLGHGLRIPDGNALLGRVVDGFCRPLDSEPLTAPAIREVQGIVPPPLDRPIVREPFHTGIRAIDGLLTMGVGQRVGVFAGPGVGKTSLLGAIASNAAVDAVVVGLIGERGREVQEFMRDGIAPDMRDKSVVVVATSDRPAAERIKSAHVACAIAESFRAQGKQVLLVLDSLTRFARALREVGLAAGEPPARRGFPPSVFAALPRLIERAGGDGKGAITAFYTVLAEGALNSDPVSEEVMSLLDGHLVLSGDLAAAGHYPAIDVLASRSRVMHNVRNAAQLAQASQVRRLMAAYKQSELLIRLGEYRSGTDAVLDEAVTKHEAIGRFLRQPLHEASASEQTLASLATLSGAV